MIGSVLALKSRKTAETAASTNVTKKIRTPPAASNTKAGYRRASVTLRRSASARDALSPERLQNVVQRARHLADPDKRDIHRGKQQGVASERIGEALA